jgi:hypothetical protein
MIQVVNDSDKDVNLSDVVTSCGCTANKRVDDRVLAGASQNLIVSIQRTVTGPFTVSVNLRLGDSQRTLRLSGDIIGRVTATQNTVLFSNDRLASIRLQVNDPLIIASNLFVDCKTKGFEVISTKVENRELVVAV